MNVAIAKRDSRFLAFLFLAGILLTGFFFSRTSLLSGSTPARFPQPGAFKGAKPLHGFPVDINSASAEELQLIPGIGRRLSKRIIEMRGRSGGFREVGDLKKVVGLTGSKLERIRPFIRVSEGRGADEGEKASHRGK